MGKRIAFLIPDGVGIRNYLYSDVVKQVIDAGIEVLIWHNLPEEVIRIAEQKHRVTLQTRRFTPKPEGALVRLLREATSYARLRYNARLKNNPTILTNWNAKRNTLGKKLLYPLAEFIGARLNTIEAIQKVESFFYALHRKSKVFREYLSEIQALDVDILFCTHQRVPFAVAPMLAAQKLGIKTVTAIFSWDNLPKARLPISADQYLVWSEYMERELLEYYPNISPDQVAITGTPQFDFYKNPECLQSRLEFAHQYELDPNQKWVLFSGDDRTTSPYDHDYLEDVAATLSKAPGIQLLFRQVPVESTQRYQSVLNNHPSIKHIPPLWEKGAAWSSFFPLTQDISLLINLARHCHAVVNIGSTVALDFAYFNSPGIYLNYDQPHAQNWSVDIIYQFEHFKTMNGLDAVGWINSKDEILNVIRKAVDSPDSIATDRLQWKKRITGTHKVFASEQIAKKLQENF